MDDPVDAAERLRPLKRLRKFGVLVLIIPIAVLGMTAIIFAINEKRQYQSITLNGIFLLAYSFAGLASPFIGIAMLLRLRQINAEAPEIDKRTLERFRVLAAANILLPVIWLIGFVLVLFSTGFSR
jgi:hypothetical protein